MLTRTASFGRRTGGRRLINVRPTQASSVAVLLLLLTAGCASAPPDPPVSQPPVVATPPAVPKPDAKPVAPARPQPEPAPEPAPEPVPEPAPEPVPEPAAVPAPSGTTQKPKAAPKDAPPVARTSPPVTRAPQLAAPPVAAPPAPAAPQALDLNTLEEQLKATKAVGIFTKISLKNQIGDLLKEFRDYYDGKGQRTMTELRRSYDLLVMKVLSLLQDDDPKLASAVFSSREAIWGVLADPKKFATLPS